MQERSKASLTSPENSHFFKKRNLQMVSGPRNYIPFPATLPTTPSSFTEMRPNEVLDKKAVLDLTPNCGIELAKRGFARTVLDYGSF